MAEIHLQVVIDGWGRVVDILLTIVRSPEHLPLHKAPLWGSSLFYVGVVRITHLGWCLDNCFTAVTPIYRYICVLIFGR